MSPPKTGAILLRIVLFANLVAIIAYGAISPQQLQKVTAECVVIGIASLAVVVQVFVTISRYTRLTYNIWSVVWLDALCAVGWSAAIVTLSYWDRRVVYTPQEGDSAAWLKCASARNWGVVYSSSDGYGHWVNIQWCEVRIQRQDRLIGNGAALQQLHVLIALSSVSLLFTGIIIFWTVRRGRYLGLIKARN
ncbi:hypothetical protein BKA67DRAFT_654337 [Truncatella angustata]|uniref:MARVEL domain-containing protein n=1 Tax=Truncatella angustata TaxID=152316 RepID=A0A9P8UZS5_9PEZI|nr:uncharacterized protein BKA67DRAFT_654337 [Truncatella angustata]KAH6661207.1 hypothetical protein BKA67DRAFT_654337 [Truncatella angustata]